MIYFDPSKEYSLKELKSIAVAIKLTLNYMYKITEVCLNSESCIFCKKFLSVVDILKEEQRLLSQRF
jgi:hypothetical protein